MHKDNEVLETNLGVFIQSIFLRCLHDQLNKEIILETG